MARGLLFDGPSVTQDEQVFNELTARDTRNVLRLLSDHVIPTDPVGCAEPIPRRETVAETVVSETDNKEQWFRQREPNGTRSSIARAFFWSVC